MMKKKKKMIFKKMAAKFQRIFQKLMETDLLAMRTSHNFWIKQQMKKIN
jgi:hypothetical protein